jgi:hypothetical protein
MSTRKVKPDPDAPEQQHSHRRGAAGMRLGAVAVIAAIGLVACSNATTPANERTAVVAQSPGVDVQSQEAVEIAKDFVQAVEIAKDFVEAYGTFDIEQAGQLLARNADISDLGGTLEGLRLEMAWFEAMGYKQILGRCEAVGRSVDGTTVRCPYDFHALRSEEIGLGPFGGSVFDVTVEDDAVVRASADLDFIDEFSPQMWEPFAKWVSETYPGDVEVMYTDQSQTDGRLTEQSFRLWEKRSREYAKEVAQS